MKKVFSIFAVSLLTLFISGCVVTQYKNKKGEDCTRRYFTVLGIPWSSCTAATTGEATPVPATEEGTAIQVAPAMKTLKPAYEKAIEQNIKAATQRVR